MEFQFNVNEYFKKPIVEIKNTLLPPDFAGDRRALWTTVNRVAEVVNEMGEASAHAQGLNKPITTAERLRQSDQNLYLLVDHEANNGNGAVTGMLKIGRKGLYVFDREGQHYQVTPPCVLDFYIHEKRQRSGLGRKLFEYMLERENVKPHNLAIDRPSEKFLNFLGKHYSLQSPIRQMNNYVVFDGFFPESKKEESSENSPMNRTNGLQSAYSHNNPSYGRYGAPRPPCSMGQIIHNTTSQKNSEPASSNNNSPNQQENAINPQTSQVHPQYGDVQSQQHHNQNNYLTNNSNRNQVNNEYSTQQYSINNVPQQYNYEPSQTPQNQAYSQVQQINPMTPATQPLQEQMRMFPEKDMNAKNAPYQDSNFYHQNSISTPIEFQRVAQTPPQQVYQMGQVVPNTLRDQHLNNTQMAQATPYQQLMPRNSNSQHSSEVNQSQYLPQQFQPAQSIQQYTHDQSIPQQQFQKQIPEIQQQLQQQTPAHSRQFQQNIPQQQFQQNIPQQQFQQHIPQQQFQQQIPQPEFQQQIPPQQQQISTKQLQQQLPHQSFQQQTPTQQFHQQIPQQHFYQQIPQTPDQNIPRHGQYSQQFINQQHFTPQIQTQGAAQTLTRPHSFQSQVPHQLVQQSSAVGYQQPGYYQQLPQTTQVYTPPETQAYGYVQAPIREPLIPEKPSQRPQPQVPSEQEKQNANKKTMEAETVASLLHVDPKYFKPDPIQMKQPPSTPVQTPQTPLHTGKKDETVASLLRAEQEVFKNGELRDEYRIPVKSREAPVYQQNMPSIQQQYQPIQLVDQGRYTPQESTHPQFQQIQQDYFDKEQYAVQKQYSAQVPYVPQQFSSPQQCVQQAPPTPQQPPLTPLQQYSQYQPQQQYIQQQEHHPQQHYVSSDQYDTQQQYVRQQQYTPPQYAPQETFSTPQKLSNDQQQNVVETQRIEIAKPTYHGDSQTQPQTPQVETREEKRQEVLQYRTGTPENEQPKTVERETREKTQEIDQKLEPQKIEEQPLEKCESKTGLPRFPTTIRQSSYIANDFNPHAEGPARGSSDVRADVYNTRVEQAPRKKGVNRQYGLNDVDMRQKVYKSAIIKRTTDAQEHETLEFGYPPQVNKKAQ